MQFRVCVSPEVAARRMGVHRGLRADLFLPMFRCRYHCLFCALVGLMRTCFLIFFIALFSGCQSLPLIDTIVRQDSTLTFEKLDGPRGDVVLSIASNADDVLYAGTRGSGVIRSTDGGDSWAQTALADETVWPVYTTPQGSILAFVRTTTSGRRVDRSTDGGRSWTTVPDSVERRFGNVVVRCRANAIYSIGGEALHRSTDDGLTWELLHPNPLRVRRNDGYQLIIPSDSVMYAQNIRAVSLSRDGGRTWRRVLEDWDTIKQLEREPSGGVLVIAGRGYESRRGYKSIKRFRISPDGSITEYPLHRNYCSSNRTILLNSGTMLSASDHRSCGIWRSEDVGRTWEQTTVDRDAVFDFMQRPDGTVYAAMHGALFRSSDDGRHWEDCTADVSPRLVFHLFTDANGMIYAGTERGGLYSSNDPMGDWGKPVYGQCRVVDGFSFRDGHIVMGATRILEATAYGFDGIILLNLVEPGLTIFATSNAGASWHTLGPTQTDLPYRIARGSDGIVYTNRDSANVSSDGGFTWSTDPMLRAARAIHASSSGLFVIHRDTLYFHEHGRDVWDELLVAPGMQTAMAIGDTLLASTGSTLKRSTDGGEHWDSWLFTKPWYNGTQFNIFSSELIAIVGKSWILLSNNGGASWREVQFDEDRFGRITSGVLDSSNHLLLGTSVGLFKSTAPMMNQ